MELYTWKLYNSINKCHPNKSIKIFFKTNISSTLTVYSLWKARKGWTEQIGIARQMSVSSPGFYNIVIQLRHIYILKAWINKLNQRLDPIWKR